MTERADESQVPKEVEGKKHWKWNRFYNIDIKLFSASKLFFVGYIHMGVIVFFLYSSFKQINWMWGR